MTGPLGVGYPDYARSFASARLFDFPAFAHVYNAPSVIGSYNTANMDSLGIRAFADLNQGRLQIKWYQDSAHTLLITDDECVIRNGGHFEQSITVKGPFATLTQNPGTGGTWTLSLVVYETTRSVIPQTNPIDNVLASQQIAVGAGLTNTFDTLRVWAGPAHLYFLANPLAVAWFYLISAIDEFGVLTRIYAGANNFPNTPSRLYLPATPLRIAVTNQDGVIRDYEYALVANPGLSGL
jgi:hypothetical protein